MTEAEWFACDKPQAMLEYLRGKASDRKLRLFAVACCRRYWHFYTGKRMRVARAAVETAERFADEQATDDELIAAAEGVSRRLDMMDGDAAVAIQLANAASQAPDAAVGHTAGAAAAGAAWTISSQAARTGLIVPESQATVLRDIFGNPLKQAKREQSWLTSRVVKLAQATYDARAFDHLPLLADALEDAGCDSQEILEHCRSGGEHVRGCWVVDLLLGKQ